MWHANTGTIFLALVMGQLQCRAAIIQPKVDPVCGYQSCNQVKDDMLNVHIIPHTHDDVGWVKTYKEYYDSDVNKIIGSVVENLKRDQQNGGDKKFIYVEMAFLKRWWVDQDKDMKDSVRSLVNEGRLEIILGGWCMNDEATPYYADIIDQHTLGFEFIRLNFGECGRPKIGWQIDPFGHSREVASLFAQFGFDGMFVGRIDYQDKEHREATKTMEMVWTASDTLGETSDIFVGVLENVYWPPDGFCWDMWCSDPELVNGDDAFKKAREDEFLQIMKEEASHYDTNHIMVEMGSDFQYRWADKWFENLDELIRLARLKQEEDSDFKVNLLYSTPSCYLYQLHRANKTWTRKHDDFFPYAHRAHSFWTGYFTSRPNLKRFVRTSGAFLQTCKQLNALAQFPDSMHTDVDINYLKEAMAVVQHHDGVSGTEKQYVADDYEMLLQNGIHYCQRVIQKAFDELLPTQTELASPKQIFCNNLAIAECKTTENEDQFVITVYNPLAREYVYHVRFPVNSFDDYEVRNHQGTVIEHQVLPISDATLAIPQRFSSEAVMEIIVAAKLPALGYTTLFVSKIVKKIDYDDVEWLEEEIKKIAEEVDVESIDKPVETIKNQFYTVTVVKETGLISRIWNIQENVAVALEQNFFYYTGHSGSNSYAEDQASGAYIFRPTEDEPIKVNPTRHVEIERYEGDTFQEIRQVFCPWVSQVIRLFDNQSHVELEWTVGPLPAGKHRFDRDGKEVITKYMTDMETDNALYTDLNGRETLKRKRDSRDTWSFRQSEKVAGNYYPITTKAFVRDERRDIQFTVLVDRSEGAASIDDGHLEIMVHRRTYYDDSLGVGEPLRENGASGKGIVARGKHYIMLNKISNAAAIHRPLAQKLCLPPLVTFSTEKVDYTEWKNLYRTQWSGNLFELPVNIHLLTFERWLHPLVPTDDTAYLLRLEHIFEKYEHDKLSSPQIVHLKKLFTPFMVTGAIELSLGANMRKDEMTRMTWKTSGPGGSSAGRGPVDIDNTLMVELSPMEIRTFQINVNRDSFF